MKKFNKNERPNKHQINKIASNTNLNEKQVNIWFIKQRLNKRKFISVKSTKKNLRKIIVSLLGLTNFISQLRKLF